MWYRKKGTSQKNLLKRDGSNVRRFITATRFLQEKRSCGIMLQVLIYTHRLSLKNHLSIEKHTVLKMHVNCSISSVRTS